MRISTFQRLLKKYRNGTATSAESYIVEVWYGSFDEDQVEDIPGVLNALEIEATRKRMLNRLTFLEE